ncbi:MAG: 6-bladed beta-propeller [Candidatus Delongbacteria bacterium]|nr:6-bladed beta-propeller [Candidatus Delongbacteria bacterium]
MKTQKLLFSLIMIIMILFVGCGKNEGAKTYNVINKDGVDIYVNKKQPSDTTATLVLKHFLTILGDVDTDDSTRIFNEIEDVEIDSQGNIFLFEARKGKIMKFDKSGKYITSFGKLGNGPGEFPFAFDLVSVEDTLYVKSFTNKQMVKFDNNGKYIQNFPYTSGGLTIGEILRSVSDEKIVGYVNKTEPIDDGILFGNNLVLLNKKFEELSVLREYSIKYNPKNIRYYETVTKFTSGDGKIFVAENDENGYRINVFDMNGKMIQQIKNNYARLEYNQDELAKIKTLNLSVDGEALAEKKSYKKSINDLFYDKYGRLLVCASIKRNEENKSNFIVDIYKDGIYLNTTKVENLIGEDFVQRFDSRIYFFGDKVYEVVNGEAKINIYTY